MSLHTYIPQPPLSNFVELLWLYQGFEAPHAKERVLPDGSMELVINLCQEPLRVYDQVDHDQSQSFGNALLCGPHSEFFIIDTVQTTVMGVHFKPGGAFPFFNLPAGELHDLYVPLETLWRAQASHLHERLLEAETLETKFHILEQTLIAQATRPLARHPAVSFALKAFQLQHPPPQISNVTDQIGLSHRRFSQVFCEEVGLTPKLFCRVQRFQEVVHCLENKQQIEWADVALTCGYFDQSHFIHDFRAFSGLNPTAYLAQRNQQHHNHVPLPL